MKSEAKPANLEAIFRYGVLSQLIHLILAGQARPEAIETVVLQNWVDLNGKARSLSVRTLYRWLAAYEVGGAQALEPMARTGQAHALPPALLDYFQQEKRADPHVSLPELIRRAAVAGTIESVKLINRSTVWRNLRRMGVATNRAKQPKIQDCRRFSFPHRMDMVLCDGKHFRVGVGRHKRVALFFIDDATRFVLAVVVGTSESAELFLRGLYQCILNHGRMIRLFVDNGPGFIALDTLEVARKLGIHLIHGTAGYPEGHGKVERFNRTVSEQLLRFMPNNAEIDSDLNSLELRLRHYLKRYHLTVHESLNAATPWQRFAEDARELCFYEHINQIRQSFIVHEERRVSRDHVVKVNGVAYETPISFAGRKILLYRNLLDNTLSLLDEGKQIRLSPVDLHDNAIQRRAQSPAVPEVFLAPPSAAQMAFTQDFSPIINDDGGFNIPEDKEPQP